MSGKYGRGGGGCIETAGPWSELQLRVRYNPVAFGAARPPRTPAHRSRRAHAQAQRDRRVTLVLAHHPRPVGHHLDSVLPRPARLRPHRLPHQRPGQHHTPDLRRACPRSVGTSCGGARAGVAAGAAPGTQRGGRAREKTCPVSTGGGTRRVRLVREGGGGGGRPCRRR